MLTDTLSLLVLALPCTWKWKWAFHKWGNPFRRSLLDNVFSLAIVSDSFLLNLSRAKAASVNTKHMLAQVMGCSHP